MSVALTIWTIIGVAAIVVDLITSFFIFIWFTVGAISAILALVFGASLTMQIIIFIAVSAGSMAVGYPLLKKTLKKTVDKTLTMEENYIGREISITDDFEKKSIIKFEGIYWTIKNTGEPLKKGDKATITGIEGNKILVKKIN